MRVNNAPHTLSPDYPAYQMDRWATAGASQLSKQEMERITKMSLDVSLTAVVPTNVFDYNITHNLGKMASEAGIYQYLWRPEELSITKASELIEPLTTDLALLESGPTRFEAFNPENGWGNYGGLVRFVRAYLAACKEYPEAEIYVSR